MLSNSFNIWSESNCTKSMWLKLTSSSLEKTKHLCYQMKTKMEKYLNLVPNMDKKPLSLVFDEHVEELFFLSIYLEEPRVLKQQCGPDYDDNERNSKKRS